VEVGRVGVRNESVRLSLEDDFTTGMAKAAAATALLNRELNSLSSNAVQTSRTTQRISKDTDAIGASAAKTDRSINQLTGRLRLFADVAAILGPSLVPIGAVGIPAIAGLANQMGAAAVAGGVMITAFQGVGEAIKAVEKARINPTEANELTAFRAMKALGPDAQAFVEQIQEMRPALRALRDEAAAGLLPGVLEGLDELESRGDDVERILGEVATSLGDMFADAGESFASARWDDFFDFLATDVPDTIESLGRTLGDLTHGMAELWMAFDPLNDDFSGWLEDIADGFDKWAQGLSETEGFSEFIDYVRANGPQVADTFAALADAILEIAEAAAPLGGPVLAGLEAVAKVIAAIADSDLGTPIMTAVGAMALLSRATATYNATASTAWGKRAVTDVKGMAGNVGALGTSIYRLGQSADHASARTQAARATMRQYAGTAGKMAGATAGLALATTGLADSLNVTNTATYGFVGAMSGLKRGGLIGAAVGGVMDLSNALSVTADDMQHFFDMTRARSGGDITAEIKALTAELERQKRIMDDGRGLDLGITKLWSSDEAARAAEKAALLKDRLAELKDEQEVAAAAADAAGSATEREGYAAARAARELQQFTDALTAQRQERIASQNATLAYEQALLDARKAAKENSDVLGRNGQLLRGQKQAGIDAKESLVGLAEAWNNQSEKIRRNTANQREAVEAFVRTARQMGYGKRAAREYAEALFNIPPKRETTITVTASGMQVVESQLNSLTKPRHVAVIFDGRASGGRFADGGLVDYYAGGGLRENHVAQIAPAGSWRVWAEPETGGEAYLPLAPAKRPRTRPIAEQAVARLGGEVRWFADGAVVERPMAPSRGASRSAAASPSELRLSGADRAELVKALLHARSLYGDVHVHGADGYDRDRILRQARG
jgi:hypothetical protein